MEAFEKNSLKTCQNEWMNEFQGRKNPDNQTNLKKKISLIKLAKSWVGNGRH